MDHDEALYKASGIAHCASIAAQNGADSLMLTNACWAVAELIDEALEDQRRKGVKKALKRIEAAAVAEESP